MIYVANLFAYLLSIYSSLIFINIIVSWFPNLYNFRIFRILNEICDGYMGVFKGYINIGSFDLTPIVGIMLFDAFVYAYFWCLG